MTSILSFRFASVLDLETTCDEGSKPSPQEVIEFPSVLFDLDSQTNVAEFSSFVRPTHNQILSLFCTSLTSITQADEGNAPVFAEVFENHMAWLEQDGVDSSHGIIVTRGDWAMARMFPSQCRVAEPGVRSFGCFFTRGLTVKTLFLSVNGQRKALGMSGMLREMGLSLEGRHHRGIDDSRNIAKIVSALVARGEEIAISGRLTVDKFPPWRLRLRNRGEVRDCVLGTRCVEKLHRLAQRVYRRRVQACFLSDGTEVKKGSDALMWLGAGAEIEVVFCTSYLASIDTWY